MLPPRSPLGSRAALRPTSRAILQPTSREAARIMRPRATRLQVGPCTGPVPRLTGRRTDDDLLPVEPLPVDFTPNRLVVASSGLETIYSGEPAAELRGKEYRRLTREHRFDSRNLEPIWAPCLCCVRRVARRGIEPCLPLPVKAPPSGPAWVERIAYASPVGRVSSTLSPAMLAGLFRPGGGRDDWTAQLCNSHELAQA